MSPVSHAAVSTSHNAGPTGIEFPLPPQFEGTPDKGYFCKGGKESLPFRWTGVECVPPPADLKKSGTDVHLKKALGEVDDQGDPLIQVFLKSGPKTRAPVCVVSGVSINKPAKELVDCEAAKQARAKISELYHHGKKLDMSKSLKAQGVFRDPSLLEFK